MRSYEFSMLAKGWLFRITDSTNNTSIIVIIGSFASDGKRTYDQHYVFCGIQTPTQRYHLESFPNEESVNIQGGNSKFNMTWSADTYGHFTIRNSSCEGRFIFRNSTISFNTSNRIPWSIDYPSTEGPEGWLASTRLLPCHYFIYSVGSQCDYSFQTVEYNNETNRIESQSVSGSGFTHIEGNYGKFSRFILIMKLSITHTYFRYAAMYSY